MFTGIVAGTGSIVRSRDEGGVRAIEIEAPAALVDGLQVGASMSVDGVCLTVTDRPSSDRVKFDAVAQSLTLTTLGGDMRSRRVNLERAAQIGAEMGGHPVSGHVDFATEISVVAEEGRNKAWRLAIPRPFERYIFDQGFVAIDGCSLTVSRMDRLEGWFEVCLIPETRRATILETKASGDRVNVEIDRATQVIVDTVRDLVADGLLHREVNAQSPRGHDAACF